MALTHLRIIPQRHNADCAVACLAMLLGLDYDAVARECKHNIATGATGPQIEGLARRLGRFIKFKRKGIDVEQATGVLCVESSKWPDQHLVLLKDGQIIDAADSPVTLWDADVFLAAYSAKVVGIYIEEGE